MSGDEARKPAELDVQLVQNLIKRCLQLYMNQKEVVDALWYQAKIEPILTQLAWKKLEEENRDYFEAYHFRLMLKNQIHIFNKLLLLQVELMQKIPLPNPSTSSTLQPQYYSYDHASTPSRLNNNMYCNGGSNGMNGINGTSIKSEAIGNSSFAFGADRDDCLLGMQTFPGAVPPLDNESSSIGFLSQIPRNLSFSDSTDDFTQRDDILENYGNSLVHEHEMNNFLDSSGDCGEWLSHDILGGTG